MNLQELSEAFSIFQCFQGHSAAFKNIYWLPVPFRNILELSESFSNSLFQNYIFSHQLPMPSGFFSSIQDHSESCSVPFNTGDDIRKSWISFQPKFGSHLEEYSPLFKQYPGTIRRHSANSNAFQVLSILGLSERSIHFRDFQWLLLSFSNILELSEAFSNMQLWRRRIQELASLLTNGRGRKLVWGLESVHQPA